MGLSEVAKPGVLTLWQESAPWVPRMGRCKPGVLTLRQDEHGRAPDQAPPHGRPAEGGSDCDRCRS